MRSVSFSLVKNEEDIIEAFVRHTLSQVDYLYIADNLSTDGTSAILKALVEEGLPLTVTKDTEQALVQNEKVTAMYREGARLAAIDFAFFLDADEFLHVDKDLMYTIRGQEGAGGAYYVPRTNYLYTDEPSPEDPLLIFSTLTTTDMQPEDPKSMIFHGEIECRRYRIGNGNHHVRDWARNGEIVSQVQPQIFATISHFPVRSVNQYLRKHILGWLALMLRKPAVNEADWTIGSHWRAQFRLIMKQNGHVSPGQVQRNLYGNYETRKGNVAPFNVTFDLKYSHLMRRKSVLIQLLEMYTGTIDGIWLERGFSENSEGQKQDPAK